MITLLIWLLFLCLIFGLILWVVRTMPLPHPFGVIAQVIVCIVFLLVLFSILMGGVFPTPIAMRLR